MCNSASLTPMSTAAEVWRRLVETGVLQPRSYDEDVVSLLEGKLPGPGALPVRMNIVQWTARDLLRALAPVVDSFAGLMRDLLSLYANIAASSATNENLTLSYEFDEGDVLDQSLAQFRSAVATLDRAQSARGRFLLSPRRWEYPSAGKWQVDNAEMRTLREGSESGSEWDLALPAAPEAADPLVARGVSLVYGILTTACEKLKTYGATMHAVFNSPTLRGRGKEELDETLALYSDFTDYWPEAVLLNLEADVKYLKSKPSRDVQSWLRGVENWCSSFWETEEAWEAESVLESVLSLPMWGKRHELYSAWVVCVIAEAFKAHHLRFEVVDGRLSFPFRATKIATFDDQVGPVELWAEVRSAASGALAHGRIRGVQPDYRFLRPGQDPSDTEMAVEAKHYRRAAATRHGDTASDYARALPRARVSIVAHGPIGGTAVERVDRCDRPRIAFRENVRSLSSVESAEFIAELQEAFPPPELESHVEVIEVTWSCVFEVEVRIITQSQGSSRDAILHRGARVQLPAAAGDAEIIAAIVCHPERRHTIDKARPCVALTFSDGKVKTFEPAQPNLSRVWHVGTLMAGSFTASSTAFESAG